MNYILLDLEWNNAYFKKTHGFINEIVEIGSVKLNENFEKIDKFKVIVKSSITNKLSGRFKELTGMTNEIMLDGIGFNKAISEYKKWAGENTVTFTWSDSDLYVLYDNCYYFTDSPDNAKLGLYADLQKIFHHELALMGKGEKNQISLSKAAEMFGINYDNQILHHAVDDSEISAEILKKCYNKERAEQFITDTNNPEFYKKLRFKSYYISNIKDPEVNKNQLFVNCSVCNKNAKRLTEFKFRHKSFSADFYCKHCNLKFKGYISFKKLYDTVEIKKGQNP